MSRNAAIPSVTFDERASVHGTCILDLCWFGKVLEFEIWGLSKLCEHRKSRKSYINKFQNPEKQKAWNTKILKCWQSEDKGILCFRICWNLKISKHCKVQQNINTRNPTTQQSRNLEIQKCWKSKMYKNQNLRICSCVFFWFLQNLTKRYLRIRITSQSVEFLKSRNPETHKSRTPQTAQILKRAKC